MNICYAGLASEADTSTLIISPCEMQCVYQGRDPNSSATTLRSQTNST